MSTIEIQDQTADHLTSKINSWLTRQCDVASVRRALLLPSSGKAVVTYIRGGFWVGTVQHDYCLKLGSTLDECLSALKLLSLA